ncbi:hypothetical protein LX32DRAFT_112051 [Colletotrichum zoysiae]|uniref:Uncharacterized protein n=1 Tax=Colletotrichum zoysiae TaxID=1216348 RepID=A0AAD9LZS0_9PEZI|nr:hypothetical protein LX32DRAFT_112051 [Colletotrichum zoysiae]
MDYGQSLRGPRIRQGAAHLTSAPPGFCLSYTHRMKVGRLVPVVVSAQYPIPSPVAASHKRAAVLCCAVLCCALPVWDTRTGRFPRLWKHREGHRQTDGGPVDA